MKTIYTRKMRPILVDDEDYSSLIKHIWCLTSKGYAITLINKRQIQMSRIITKAHMNLYVDHANHNTTDNRKENLRVCTQSQNMRNANIKRNNTSGVSGVYFNKQSRKWMARIKVNYKYIYLGIYKIKQDAINARKEAEVKYFGEFRLQEAF